MDNGRPKPLGDDVPLYKHLLYLMSQKWDKTSCYGLLGTQILSRRREAKNARKTPQGLGTQNVNGPSIRSPQVRPLDMAAGPKKALEPGGATVSA
jgi:hypothetical protein